MSKEVKVYKINWQDGDHNSFVGSVISLRDHDQAIAAKDAILDEVKDAFAAARKQDAEVIAVLEARLKKCQSQRDDYIFDENSKANLTDLMGEQIRADDELLAITIDSIKRGEE
jgi:hypothetical protein